MRFRRRFRERRRQRLSLEESADVGPDDSSLLGQVGFNTHSELVTTSNNEYIVALSRLTLEVGLDFPASRLFKHILRHCDPNDELLELYYYGDHCGDEVGFPHGPANL